MTKCAIIVGATSGIGRGLAELLVSEGYKVGITGRREHLLNEIKESSPGCYVTKTFDLDNYSSVAEHLDTLAEELGNVELFILSSGTGKRNPQLELDPEMMTVKTNVAGFTSAINWAYRYMEKRGGGSIASISSIAGIRGFGLSPSYSSSKSYQIRYLEALRQKSMGAQNKVVVTDIRPGFVDTDMGNADGAFWIAPVDKSSKQILRGIKRKKGVVYVTKRWFFVALLLRLAPEFIFTRLKL